MNTLENSRHHTLGRSPRSHWSPLLLGALLILSPVRGLAAAEASRSSATRGSAVASQRSTKKQATQRTASAEAAKRSVASQVFHQGPDIANELGNMAVAANPSVDALESRVAALQEKVQRAKVWMDPVFSAEYSSMPIDAPYPGQHAMSGVQFTLKQTVYWPGKLRTREVEAQSQVRQAELSLAEQKVQLRAAVKRAYYRLALARQLREVTKRHIGLVANFVELARVRNAAGTGAQHEQLRLQVLSDQLRDDVKTFDSDEASLSAAINATLHRELDVPIPTPDQTPLMEPKADAGALIRRAERERPLLERFKADAAAYQAAARRASREGYPDITLWGSYRVRTEAGADPGTDFFSVGVSLPLPITYDDRWGSERRQNEKMATAALHDRAAALDEIRGNLGRVTADWKRAVEQARTYRQQLTPEATMTLDATFASYQVDRADVASLFQAEVQLLNFERTTRMAETTAAEASVDAEALVGNGVM